jgi:hypothetical protein
VTGPVPWSIVPIFNLGNSEGYTRRLLLAAEPFRLVLVGTF